MTVIQQYANSLLNYLQIGDFKMCPVLKLDRHGEVKETIFELKYLLSLTTRQRFEMMLKKNKRDGKFIGEKWTQKAF